MRIILTMFIILIICLTISNCQGGGGRKRSVNSISRGWKS